MVPKEPNVAMYIDDTVHYKITGPQANDHWESLLPPSGHLYHSIEDSRTYTVAMFHQLECLTFPTLLQQVDSEKPDLASSDDPKRYMTKTFGTISPEDRPFYLSSSVRNTLQYLAFDLLFALHCTFRYRQLLNSKYETMRWRYASS